MLNFAATLNLFPAGSINIVQVRSCKYERESHHGWYAKGKGSPEDAIFVFVKQGGEIRARDLRRGHNLRIDSSMIGMESARRYSSSTTRTSRFLVKDESGEPAHGTMGMFSNLLNPDTESRSESTGEENGTENNTATPDAISELRERVENIRLKRINVRSSSQEVFNSFRQQTIRSIFAMLFGSAKAESVFGKVSESVSLMQSDASLTPVRTNILTLSSEQLYEESEETSFTAKGLVRTADGREISISVDVGMSRKFTSYFKEELQIAQINTCDPLVLNFDGAAAELTDQKFYFDIDADGEEDEISMLGSGSGYLALDENGDGIINDGSELFGPKSGSGFRDLAAYDEDKNGWIDENDAIWSKLKIWCKNGDGTDSLYTLSEKGVGAICLQNASTDFSLNNAQNRTNGFIRNSGIFLYENGNVGTVQHLDVAQ